MNQDEIEARDDLLEAYREQAAQLAYVVGHDLRAPVRNIADYAAMLERELAGRLEGDAALYLARLRNRAERLHNMIEGVRSYARAGRDPAEPERVALPGLVEEIVTLVDPNRRASVQFDGPLRELVAPRGPLEQVLRQLIDNAIRHSGRPRPRVRVRAEAAGPRYAFAVSDDGVGIPLEARERVWELFHTVHGTVDDAASPGVGLGIVRKLVGLHGGRAWAESTPGDGATFHFTWRRPRDADAGP